MFFYLYDLFRYLFIDDTIFSPSYLQRMASERSSKRLQISTSASIDASCPASPQHSPTHQPCKTTVLLIVMHAGSVLGDCHYYLNKLRRLRITYKNMI